MFFFVSLIIEIDFMKQLFLSLLIVAGLFACKSKEKKVDEQKYEEQKTNLLTKEKESPKHFLVLTGDDHRNLFGKTVYNGIIKNNATVCAYKGVRVKLLYFKNGTQVANHEEVFDNTIEPNDDFSFKAKYKTPKGTDSVAAYIMTAKPVQN